MSSQFVGGQIYIWGNTPPIPPPHSQADWNTIPEEWTHYRWDAMDVLTISPFIVTPTFGFGLGMPYESGNSNVTKRYEWVVANAREANPKLKIVALHWYDNDPHGMGLGALDSDGKIDQFTTAVTDFLLEQSTKTLTSASGKKVSARIDGYDIDVESFSDVDILPQVIAQLRQKFDNASRANSIEPFTLSICPAWMGAWADKVKEGPFLSNLDFIDLQRYSGGYGNPASSYFPAVPGLEKHVEKITWGISGENTAEWNPDTLDGTLAQIKAGVDVKPYGGAWIWRMNSGNSIFENMLQVTLYNSVHGVKLPNTPDYELVRKGWEDGGGENDTPPFNTWHWQT